MAIAYLLTGRCRYDPRLALSDSISLNQIVAVGLIASLIARAWQNRQRQVSAPATMGAVLMLTALLALRLHDSGNPEYGAYKLLGYVLVLAPVLLYVEIRASTRPYADRFLKIFVIGALALVAVSVPRILLLHPGERLAVLGGGPNVLGRILGTGILSMLGLWVAGHVRPRRNHSLSLASMLVAMVLTGSKAPLLSLPPAIALMLYVAGRRRTAWIFLLVFAAAAVVPFLLHPLVRDLPKDGAIVRLLRLPDTDDSFGSWGSRLRFWQGSWEQIRAHPWFGVGAGAWGLEHGMGINRSYPHNILVEILVELGVTGIVLIAVSSCCAARLASRRRAQSASPSGPPWTIEADRLKPGILALALYWAINVQFSGDLVDSRYLWFFLVLLEPLLLHRVATSRTSPHAAHVAAAPFEPGECVRPAEREREAACACVLRFASP